MTNEARGSSHSLVDLHVAVVPTDHWIEKLNYASQKVLDETISAGFVRVHPDRSVLSLREDISKQIGSGFFSSEYVFLRHVGRCLAMVHENQENLLKARDFVPPRSDLPELFILPSRPASYHRFSAYSSLSATTTEIGGQKRSEYVKPGENPSSHISSGTTPTETASQRRATGKSASQERGRDTSLAAKTNSSTGSSAVRSRRFIKNDEHSVKNPRMPTQGMEHSNQGHTINHNHNTASISRNEILDYKGSYEGWDRLPSGESESRAPRGDQNVRESQKQLPAAKSVHENNEGLSGVPVNAMFPVGDIGETKQRNVLRRISPGRSISGSQDSSSDKSYRKQACVKDNGVNEGNPFELAQGFSKDDIDGKGPRNVAGTRESQSSHGSDPKTATMQNGGVQARNFSPDESNGQFQNDFSLDRYKWARHITSSGSDGESERSVTPQEPKVLPPKLANQDNGRGSEFSRLQNGFFVADPANKTSHGGSNTEYFSQSKNGLEVKQGEGPIEEQYSEYPTLGDGHDKSMKRRSGLNKHIGTGGRISVRDRNARSQDEDEIHNNDRYHDDLRERHQKDSAMATRPENQFGSSENQVVRNIHHSKEHIVNSSDFESSDHNARLDSDLRSGNDELVDSGGIVESFISNEAMMTDERNSNDSKLEGHEISSDASSSVWLTPDVQDGPRNSALSSNGEDFILNKERKPLNPNFADNFGDEGSYRSILSAQLDSQTQAVRKLSSQSPNVADHESWQDYGNREHVKQSGKIEGLDYTRERESSRTDSHLRRDSDENSITPGTAYIRRQNSISISKIHFSSGKQETYNGTDTDFNSPNGDSASLGHMQSPSVTPNGGQYAMTARMPGNNKTPSELKNRIPTPGLNQRIHRIPQNQPSNKYPYSSQFTFDDDGSIGLPSRGTPDGTMVAHSDHKTRRDSVILSEGEREGRNESFSQERPQRHRDHGPGDFRQSNDMRESVSIPHSRASLKSTPGFFKYANRESDNRRQTDLLEPSDATNNRKNELLQELERARAQRAYFEEVRQGIMKKAKAVASQITRKRGGAKDVWKRRYYDEKKKTESLQEIHGRLRNQRDSVDINPAENLPSYSGVAKRTTLSYRDERPSFKNSSKIEARRSLLSITDLKKRLAEAKAKLAAEMKMRHEAENKMKSVRQGLLTKKIQSHLALRRMNHLRELNRTSRTLRMRNNILPYPDYRR